VSIRLAEFGKCPVLIWARISSICLPIFVVFLNLSGQIPEYNVRLDHKVFSLYHLRLYLQLRTRPLNKLQTHKLVYSVSCKDLYMLRMSGYQPTPMKTLLHLTERVSGNVQSACVRDPHTVRLNSVTRRDGDLEGWKRQDVRREHTELHEAYCRGSDKREQTSCVCQPPAGESFLGRSDLR
jgi:hypothetical protein